jgi:hypothetical protein
MKGSMTHTATLGDDAGGNITRINNAFDKIPQRLASVEAQLETYHSQQENARAELGKPFEKEQEFTEKSARLAELDSMLNIDGKPDAVIMGGADEEIGADEDTAIAAKTPPISAKGKPSLLETLEKNEAKSKAMFGGGNTEKSKKDEVIV